MRADLDDLLDSVSAAEARWAPWLAAVDAGQRDSARNLVHYWALRQHDLRDLQGRLAGVGLSSLGRSESHVEDTLRTVAAAVAALAGDAWHPPSPAVAERGARVLRRRAADLLGPAPPRHRARIMVTLPGAVADDPALVRLLIRQGMDVARINCAHDDPAVWRAMARHVRTAAAEAQRPCRIVLDLAGPKLRTGALEPGPRVVRLRTEKDALGHVRTPARGWLTSVEHPVAAPEPGLVPIPVPEAWLGSRQDGEELSVRDARGRRRTMTVALAGGGAVVSTERTTYLATGCVLGSGGVIGAVPPLRQSLLLRPGDVLELVPDCSPLPVVPGRPRIGCTLPEVFEHAHVGDQVLFDDGKVSGVVLSRRRDSLRVRVDRTKTGGARLGADKGINLPDTRLPVSAVTAKDLEDLTVVSEIADAVGLSFLRGPEDVERLLNELTGLGATRLGVVLKIETKQAFQNLPQVLLTAMRWPRVGVMIARGDLAAECGYERTAELQEEILWLCEAAHLPVIWATQVLEQLAKEGQPSRAEITDAAMSERAECVMLNKGPFVAEAVSVLSDVLHRMSGHHYKKNPLLRSLRSWQPDHAAGK